MSPEIDVIYDDFKNKIILKEDMERLAQLPDHSDSLLFCRVL